MSLTEAVGAASTRTPSKKPLQVLVEFGNQLGVVGIAAFKRHHALQQLFVERRIAGKTDLAQGVTRTAVIDKFDIGDAGPGVYRQCLASETPTEKAVARSLVLDQALGVFVMPVVEYGAGCELVAGGYAKALEVRGRAVDPNGHVAQMHRFAGLDGEGQARVLAAHDRTHDPWLIETQRLGPLCAPALRRHG
jgi:hypothetical protein